jgi:hypothetical protein
MIGGRIRHTLARRIDVERLIMTAYVALLRKQPDSDYGVDFPDFPGCITAGKTLDDARGMSLEARGTAEHVGRTTAVGTARVLMPAGKLWRWAR